MSLAVSSQAVAAVKWNNSGGEESKSDPTNFWDRTKNAKKCFSFGEFDHFSDKISIKKITVQDKKFCSCQFTIRREYLDVHMEQFKIG